MDTWGLGPISLAHTLTNIGMLKCMETEESSASVD